MAMRTVKGGWRAAAVRVKTQVSVSGAGSRVASLFPGQGSQSVGMGADLAHTSEAANRTFEAASDICGYDVLRVCSEGPEEVLNQTDVSQPAIYTCSLAALESLRNSDSEACSDIERTGLTAGLSLGEYTALTFAGSIGFEDGLRLVKERGEAMQAASQQNPGGMATVVGLRLDQTQELVRRAKENTGDADNAMLEVANILCPGNYTISGSTNAIDEAEKLAQDSGSELKAKRFIRLPVAGAFHTQLMNPAAERLKQALDKVEVAKPKLSVLSNATAREYASTSDVRELLRAQLVSPVRFEECIRYMLECGFGQCYEIGPGQAIAGLLKRMQPPASVSSISA